MLTWIHVGDLHVSDEDAYASVGHLATIVEGMDDATNPSVDFVFLPGDNANHATEEQYARIREHLDRLGLPFHAIPGDHDFETGSLDEFYKGLGESPLPKVIDIKGFRCLFLDIVSAGGGGPDFRLGTPQTTWVDAQLAAARRDGIVPVVFMHAYPGDLTEGGAELARAFAQAGVAFVDTGHTHYNELLNDGSVIYGATRSTGQIEEDDGAPGYAMVNLDDGVVSWRFRRLGDNRPFVMITQPADYRLVTSPVPPQVVASGRITVRAKIMGQGIERVTLAAAGSAATPMEPVSSEPGVWQGSVAIDAAASRVDLVVSATDRDGRVGTDEIVAVTAREAASNEADQAATPGTDAHAIPAWETHGILGTQLGPNKHGKHW